MVKLVFTYVVWLSAMGAVLLATIAFPPLLLIITALIDGKPGNPSDEPSDF